MRTLVTGAFGRVGTALIDHGQSDDEYVYFDRKAHPRFEAVLGDIADYDTVSSAMTETDAVVHLAAAARVDAEWSNVLKSNIIGGYNCLEAARQRSVSDVVIASTNHVVGMYEEEHAPQVYSPEYDLTLDASTPPRPDSYYATSKVFLESLGRYYAEKHEYPKRVCALRIGSVRNQAYDHPYGDAERGVASEAWMRGDERYEREVRRMKATWLSRRDAAQLIEKGIHGETDGFDVFYGVSNNSRRWFDIADAADRLDYEPIDDADKWDTPPEGGRNPVQNTASN